MRLFYLLSVICFLLTDLSAQRPPQNDAEFEKAYERRIRQEQLHGVYIPKDLADVFVQLNRKIDKESQVAFRSMSEEDAVNKLYFSLGRWIIHNWGFYGGSRLSAYMKRSFDVHHPEDMAAFLIIAYHRNLNRNPLEIKQLIEFFREKKAKDEEARRAKGTVIHEETRQRTDGGN